MAVLTLLGGNGDVIPFDPALGYIQASGTRGFGISPTVLTLLEGAGDGAIFRYSRRGPRDIDLPIVLCGVDRADVESMQSRIASALIYNPSSGPAQLQWMRGDGSMFTIGVHYVAGAETQDGGDTGGAVFSKWLLTLRCPDPYWTAQDELAFTLTTGGVVRGLLPRLAKLQVSSAQVLGTVVVNNPGTVTTPIKWQIQGPGTQFAATAPNGQGFTLNATLLAGDVRFVDTASGGVTDAAGTNHYSELATAPKLFSLPPGRSSLSVLMTGATSASRVIGRYKPKRELVY